MIDTTFDFRNDSFGKDPDQHSPTLRRYHRVLWSKPLPSGKPFELVDTTPRVYLHHRSDIGEFELASDSVIATFKGHSKMAHILNQIPNADVEAFERIGYTIGGMLVFPGYQIGGQTINQVRGCNGNISDRLDLTLECIRRYYLGENSVDQMSNALARYHEFFTLFRDFRGYVDFFLLQDLVTADGAGVKFFMPFDDFQTPALPNSLDEYLAYRATTIAFVEARNRRIANLYN